MLSGKMIILGISGGIAVYKAAELARLLKKSGADLHVIMTAAAQQFVTPFTFQTLTGNPVHTELFNLIAEQEIGHISLADKADLFLVAPATANIIGKIANGICDDMLTTTIMATKAPVVIAPAMNCNMYSNSFYRRNEEKLASAGYTIVPPEKGELACGVTGEGRLAAPETIVEYAAAALSPKDLVGETILITAGPTREGIDPVRFISNHSSGKMGYAIARAAWQRGARVILVTGPVALKPPSRVELVKVTTADEMFTALLELVPSCSIVIKAAAVADYRVAEEKKSKIKKSGERMSLELVKNRDILAALGSMEQPPLLVGFAAETDDLKHNAAAKLAAKNLDMIVANDVSSSDAGFHVDTNRALFLYRDGSFEEQQLMSKDALAHLILSAAKSCR